VQPQGYAPKIVPDPAAADVASLVTAAQGGDRDALDRLLRHHQDQVYALARRLTGNHTDALDATQEALVAIVRGLPRFDGRSAFSTWVYRVATNACLDELRRRSRRSADPLPDLEDPSWQPPGAGGSGRTDPSGSVADRIDIDRALATLPPEFRAPVVLRDLCGLDYAEISEVLDIPPGTVRSRIARGRAALARTMTGNQTGSPDRPNLQP
jgi:RNA polymerase sigma-70 factor (ECF subfamily)